jgi:muramoyltetrapeptide carboxypeptidase
MKLTNRLIFAALAFCGVASITSCHKDDDEVIIEKEVIVTKELVLTTDAEPLNCVMPPYLQKGDKVALISPSYATPMENIEKTADVLRGWGFEPVIGPNTDKTYANKFAGTVAERVSDIRWALNNSDVKAIICNRGGYGSIQLVEELALKDLATHPKWFVGFSDITTLHGMLSCAGVMSIHGTMSTFIATSGGTDVNSTLMRDLLMGNVPRYTVPAHSQNINGKGTGTLVGGNICTFVPLIGSKADATAHKDIILFIEEIGETMHNIDRLFNMLILNGSIARCKGVILGEFESCSADLGYSSVEAMLHQYFEKFNIPVLCGFPAGHGNVNLPLVMGATATINVSANGSTIEFDIDGQPTDINTSNPMPALALSPDLIMMMAGKIR